MGKTVTPTYRIEYRDQKGWHTECWTVKTQQGYGYGTPNLKNLEKWRKARHDSFRAGGVNEHVSEFYGFIPHISKVNIIRQRNGETMVEFVAPMFEVC